MSNAIAENMYLTFSLNDGTFAFPVSRVREVLEHTTFVKIPRTPQYMMGVLNLRGHALPVADLKRKLGMGEVSMTRDASVIVAELENDESEALIGCLVDSVHEVLDLPPEAIDPPPSMGTGIDSDFINGIGKIEGRFVVILDIDRIFASDEVLEFQAVAEAINAE